MALLIVPACLLVLALLIGPMILMFRISLNQFSPTQLMVQALSPDNYIKAATDPYYQQIILATLGIALLCTLLTLILAFPAAYWLGRMESRWKSLVVIATLFPLLVGNVVRSAGWMALFARDGLVNASLLKLGLISTPLEIMFTTKAVIIGIIAVVLPYMILTLSAVIESIPRDLEYAAANLGASGARVFWRVILPLSGPGVAAGSILVFVLCMNTYATAVLLGGPRFKMMAPAVYDQFVRGNNWPMGAALAFMLLAVTMAFTVFGSVAFARKYRTG
ncbi:Putative ABC transporter (permease protein) [Bradyrhizobium sp. ORS 285]|uniref:ABC transporter permease n=1 Tax=Bradyrhizobium sp. ORS 285 TaxID=115808 RepID=UPI000240AB18|nr:ABC transporter permease [Bradyrhizobium sp. ORS 285]CCD84124.1 putative ABC transporter (permease protein) [Bradyrhizobium sp. ORS 285]SMX60639.1 Putative ABC transporter (permease protein) [Bradyrhizobium sp. ORS 285]